MQPRSELPPDSLHNLHPETFELHNVKEKREFLQLAARNPDWKWICKPVGANRGQVRQLRHHSGSFLTLFPALHHRHTRRLNVRNYYIFKC